MMDKLKLQALGRQLAEGISTTANFEAFTSDLKAKLKSNTTVVASISKVSKDGGKTFMPNVFIYTLEVPSNLKEEAIPIKMASDVWKDHKDDAKNYISNQVYYVKPDGDKFLVTIEQNNKRKTFATLSKVELDKSFVEVRPNQTPDAEGFIQYRYVDQIEAFKFDDDTIKVELDNGDQLLLNLGDYLTRKANENDFTYEVKKSKDFETHYEQKK
jgi:hypothetical protein